MSCYDWFYPRHPDNLCCSEQEHKRNQQKQEAEALRFLQNVKGYRLSKAQEDKIGRVT